MSYCISGLWQYPFNLIDGAETETFTRSSQSSGMATTATYIHDYVYKGDYNTMRTRLQHRSMNSTTQSHNASDTENTVCPLQKERMETTQRLWSAVK